MRALLLLMIAALSIWLAVRVFSGAQGESPAAGAVPPRSGAAPTASSVQPSPPAAAATAAARTAPAAGTPAPATAGTAGTAPPAAASHAPPTLASVLPAAADPKTADAPRASEEPAAADAGLELALAAQVAHSTPSSARAWAARLVDSGLPKARRRALEAFAAALAGDSEVARPLADALATDRDVDPRDAALVARALGRAPRVIPASTASASESALQRAMRVAVAARDGLAHCAAGRFAAGVEALSETLVAELDAPWTPDRAALAGWSRALNQAQRNHRFNPRASWASVDTQVQSGDTLGGIAKSLRQSHPELAPSPGLLKLVNRCGDNIQPGQTLRLPAEPMRIEADVGARWVMLLMGDEVVGAWEVAVGRPGNETITGAFSVGEMQRNPQWFPVGQPPVPFGDPANPLGTRWISWDRDGRSTGFGFHGTREPETVGTACSDGCMRMRNEDVELLYEIVARGVPVTVRP